MNIVLITCDSLRYDRLSCNGFPLATSPNIDNFAKRAHKFSYAFSDGPNTPHAFPAIFASRPALMSNRFGLFDAPKVLAEVLRDAGYHTIGINAANPYVSRYFKYDRGFDFFKDYLEFDISSEDFDGRRKSAPEDSAISIPGLDMERYLVTEENIRSKAELENTINFEIFEQIEKNQDEPFFLWVHYMDTHYPYLPQQEAQLALGNTVISKEENFRINQAIRESMPLSPELLGKANRLYNATVKQLDNKIVELFDWLNQKNLFDSAMIVLSADHGEEFLEHGDLQHKSKLFDELLHVPLFIKLPFQMEPKQNPDLVSLLQLAPTILSEAGCENSFAYKSIFSHLNDSNVPDRKLVFGAASFNNSNGTPVGENMSRLHVMPKRFSCRSKTNKIILETGGNELGFNLVTDPTEQVNVGSESQPLKKMKESLTDYVKTLEKLQAAQHVMRLRENLTS